MANKVKILKSTKTLGHNFKEGDIVNVSSSIYKTLIEEKNAEDFKEKKAVKKQKKEEE